MPTEPDAPGFPAHLAQPPDPAFWEDTLFFGRFEEILAEATGSGGVGKLIDEVFCGAASRAVVDAITLRAGGGANPLLNLALVGRFTEHKKTDAVEAVALAALAPALVDSHRTPGGKVRRHPLMVLLYERDPQLLLAVDLWHRHLSRRPTRYRRKPALDQPLAFDPERCREVAGRVLGGLRAKPASGFRGFDEVRVFACEKDADLLVALREWPGRTTGRTRAGDVLTVDLPDWTVLHLSAGGDRLDVTDRQVDRAARFAGELVRELATADGAYEVILEPLSDTKLDEFLERITDPRDTAFPLVEIVAQVPWRPHHVATLTGTPRHTTEELVADERRLGSFAQDWRTVRSVKLRFEDRYKIQVHFPPAGQPVALTFSAMERSPKVTKRFTDHLQAFLHVELAPRARRGTALPAVQHEDPPRRLSIRWWASVLAPLTDHPAEWLEDAVASLEAEGLVRVERSRVFHCGSPYIDRRAVPVDSLDCDGEVEMPLDNSCPDDPTRDDTDGEYWCSLGEHRWEPVRYGLPTFVRFKVEPRHDAVWTRLLAEYAHYGEVREEPGRPGVASIRLDHALLHLVYLPLVEDPAEAEPATFGSRTPAAWVRAPGSPPPGTPVAARDLADVLADPACLADAWGVPLARKRTPHAVERAGLVLRDGTRPARGCRPLRLIEIDDEGITLDGKPMCGPGHRADEVFSALRMAAAQDEGDGAVRQPWGWDKLDALLPDERRGGSEGAWRTWVSRARKAVVDSSGDERDRMKVVVTCGGRYRLGDGFHVVDHRVRADRLQAPPTD